MKKRELESYCGDVSQIFGVQPCILDNGRDKGTRAYLVDNGAGITCTILRDKCFAIPSLKFKGLNIGFLCKNGISSPEFFQEEGTRGFLRNFEGGFLTTCGLTYFGTPTVREGQPYGLHGVISNTPMENASAEVLWKGDDACIEVRGQAREGYLFGPNLVIRKKIEIPVGGNLIRMHDTVENKGFEKEILMLLYHFNYGYPFLDESCSIYTNYNFIRPRDSGSQGRLDHLDSFAAPMSGFEEVVAYRTMSDKAVTQGRSLVWNRKRQVAVRMTLNADHLPVMNEWQSPRAGDYVLGMEPGTGTVGGLEGTEKAGLTEYIEPGEIRKFDITVEFLDDDELIREAVSEFSKEEN